ncbi:MAG: cyclic nucleotide-binding domain-containing protein [Deltaproteobacteria bacterium]|nr:cyclic nucleotide-binding domain-containing protein [Deltaproteobacteria bacterium]
MDTRETVKNTSIFRNLDDNELAEVLNITREKRVHQGDTIMQEGDKGDTMYMIVEGEVGVSKTLTMKFGDDDYRETEKVLIRFRPEDHAIFGEMALIAQDSRSASISAKTDCVLLEIKRGDFIRLIDGNPRLGTKVLLNLSELLISRLKQSSQDVIRLTTALSIALSR